MCSARLAGIQQGSPVRRPRRPNQGRPNQDRPNQDKHRRVSSDLSLSPEPKRVTRLRPSPNPNLRPGPPRLPPNDRLPVNGRHSLRYRCGIRRRRRNPSNRSSPDWELQRRVRSPKAVHRLHPNPKAPPLRQRPKHRRQWLLPGLPEVPVLWVPRHRKLPPRRSKGLEFSQVHRRRPGSQAGNRMFVPMTRPDVPHRSRAEHAQRKPHLGPDHKPLLRPDHKLGCRPDRLIRPLGCHQHPVRALLARSRCQRRSRHSENPRHRPAPPSLRGLCTRRACPTLIILRSPRSG